jgi:hypothetical protein
VQETGFSSHLPTGNGIFAVKTVEEAADAIEVISKDLETQSRRARDIAVELFDARRVLGNALSEIAVGT